MGVVAYKKLYISGTIGGPASPDMHVQTFRTSLDGFSTIQHTFFLA